MVGALGTPADGDQMQISRSRRLRASLQGCKAFLGKLVEIAKSEATYTHIEYVIIRWLLIALLLLGAYKLILLEAKSLLE